MTKQFINSIEMHISRIFYVLFIAQTTWSCYTVSFVNIPIHMQLKDHRNSYAMIHEINNCYIKKGLDCVSTHQDRFIEDCYKFDIFNEQTDIPLDLGCIQRQLHLMKKLLNISQFEVTVSFVSTAKMKKLNSHYLKQNTSTDILTFPYNPVSINEPLLIHTKQDSCLGDIFIDPNYIQEQCDKDLKAMEYSLMYDEGDAPPQDGGVSGEMSTTYSVKRRIPLLLIHGLLHLLGYDHVNDDDNQRMMQKETELIQLYKLNEDSISRSSIGEYIIGIGTDICSKTRLLPIVKKYESLLLNRLLSTYEKRRYEEYREAYLASPTRRATQSWERMAAAYLAKKFAAKEAVSKALGTGLRFLSKGGIRLREIEVLNKPSGQPIVELRGDALKVANRKGVANLHISMTDELDTAIAFVTATGSLTSI